MCIGAILPRLRACLLLPIFRVNITQAMKLGPQRGRSVGRRCGERLTGVKRVLQQSSEDEPQEGNHKVSRPS